MGLWSFLLLIKIFLHFYVWLVYQLWLRNWLLNLTSISYFPSSKESIKILRFCNVKRKRIRFMILLSSIRKWFVVFKEALFLFLEISYQNWSLSIFLGFWKVNREFLYSILKHNYFPIWWTHWSILLACLFNLQTVDFFIVQNSIFFFKPVIFRAITSFYLPNRRNAWDIMILCSWELNEPIFDLSGLYVLLTRRQWFPKVILLILEWHNPLKS